MISVAPSYEQLVERLYQAQFAKSEGLTFEHVARLAEALGRPQDAFSIIHVAGSNGKGSVCTKLAKALEFGGYRVGLFLSPHIGTFRERMQVNGEFISKEEVKELLPSIFEVVEKEQQSLTVFETFVLLALVYFREKGVDVAVLETGLGGRLDATNFVIPIISAITAISLDHTHLLGNTLEAITKEKAGIIKKGVPVVALEGADPILEKIAEARGSSLSQVSAKGSPNEQNQRIAGKVLEAIQSSFPIAGEALKRGLACRPPCRFEELKGENLPPAVILDVAHNPQGAKAVAQEIQQKYPTYPVRVLLGLSQNKDHEAFLSELKTLQPKMHLVQAEAKRALPLEEVEELARKLNLSIETSSTNIGQSVKEALQKARENDEVLLICGSFYIMAEARQALGYAEFYESVDFSGN